jgi:hypothetical protein
VKRRGLAGTRAFETKGFQTMCPLEIGARDDGSGSPCRCGLFGDGTLIGVANYPGCAERSEFAGFARYGFATSTHRYVWGVRLVLLTDDRGLPLGYTIVPANEKEYEPRRVARARPEA